MCSNLLSWTDTLQVFFFVCFHGHSLETFGEKKKENIIAHGEEKDQAKMEIEKKTKNNLELLCCFWTLLFSGSLVWKSFNVAVANHHDWE